MFMNSWTDEEFQSNDGSIVPQIMCKHVFVVVQAQDVVSS